MRRSAAPRVYFSALSTRLRTIWRTASRSKAHRRQPLLHRHQQRGAVGGHHRLDERQPLAHGGPEVAELGAQAQPVLLHLRVGEDVGDEPPEPLGLVGDALRVLAHAGGVAERVRQHLAVQADAGERVRSSCAAAAAKRERSAASLPERHTSATRQVPASSAARSPAA
jgi:hypothetical protein